MLALFGWFANASLDWLTVAVKLLTVASVVAGAGGFVVTSIAVAHAYHEGRKRSF